MSAAPPSTFPIPFPAPQTSSPLPVPKAWRTVPFPVPAPEIIPLARLSLPAWPSMWGNAVAPAANAPAPETQPLIQTPEPPAIPVTPPVAAVIPEPAATSWPPFEAVPSTVPAAPAAPASAETEPADFTDKDLQEAFAPIFQQALKDVTFSSSGLDPQLEPLLRSTIRRALAEYSPGQRPFTPPGAWDRFAWRTQALFTSRSYEDILFEKTHRFHVEEVYLLDTATLALVSYASINPARHSSTRRIQGTVQRLALQVRDEQGTIRPHFKLADGRNVISQKGKFIILMAVIRGVPTELALNDLTFTLETIEHRFHDHFTKDGSPLLRLLQPFLEDCLLIQAPASAA